MPGGLEAPCPYNVKPYNRKTQKSMSLVSLELFKKHVRADDFNADDEQLQQYLDAAEQQVIMATNRTENELVEMGGGVFPPMLAQAVLLVAAAWYATPENTAGVQYHEVPYGATALIKPFRKLAD